MKSYFTFFPQSFTPNYRRVSSNNFSSSNPKRG